jgi:Ca2+-binding EF-hand superfamily protein
MWKLSVLVVRKSTPKSATSVSKEVNRLSREYGLGHSGEMSRLGFARMLREGLGLPCEHVEVEQLFRTFDIDNSKQISAVELVSHAKAKEAQFVAEETLKVQEHNEATHKLVQSRKAKELEHHKCAEGSSYLSRDEQQAAKDAGLTEADIQNAGNAHAKVGLLDRMMWKLATLADARSLSTSALLRGWFSKYDQLALSTKLPSPSSSSSLPDISMNHRTKSLERERGWGQSAAGKKNKQSQRSSPADDVESSSLSRLEFILMVRDQQGMALQVSGSSGGRASEPLTGWEGVFELFYVTSIEDCSKI